MKSLGFCLEALWVSGQDIRANDAIKLLFHLLNCPTKLSGKGQKDKMTKEKKTTRQKDISSIAPQSYLGKDKKTKLSLSQTFIEPKSNFKKLTGCLTNLMLDEKFTFV